MKKSNLTILFLVLLCLLGNFTNAQEKENPFSVSLDLMSRYVWRGMDFGGSPSIQPGIEYNKGAFTVGAWSAYTTNMPGVQEVDLYVGYALSDEFSITITDYFFPDETDADYEYFDFDDKTTGHVLEATLSFNGTENLPLSVFVATNFWGADALKADGKIQYSTYAECSYSFKNIDLFMGMNLSNPDEEMGETSYFGDSFGVTNLGISTSKEIQLTESFSLPVSASLITNPQANKVYMVVGISL